MSIEAGREARQRAENYRRALKYLDSVRGFTYENFAEMNRIAGNLYSESDMRRMLAESQYALPTGGEPGGAEFLKMSLRNSLIEGISVFESVADKFGVPAQSSGCFLATVAFGSSLASEVRILRAFRDNHLLSHPAGRLFVRLYYRFGPKLARKVTGNRIILTIIRVTLRSLCRVISIRLH